MKAVCFADRKIGPGNPCYVIAEIGINHNGSLAIAKRLIDVAVEAGCDAVKFQKRDVPTVYTAEELATPRAFDPSFIAHARERAMLGGKRRMVLPDEACARLFIEPERTTNGDLKWSLEFGLAEFDEIERHCKSRGIHFAASSWDGLSAHFMNGFDVAWHKIASPCLTHDDLLRRVRSNRKPVILSTGGSTLEQITHAVEVLGTQDLVLLHCVSTYPARDEDANLEVMNLLRRAFPDVPVGYSGHEEGILPSLVAASMGACVIERHITLDKKMPGSDQKASLAPAQMAELVTKIRALEAGTAKITDWASAEDLQKICGDGVKRVLDGEIATMKKLRRV